MAKDKDLLTIKRGEMIINKVNELILSKIGKTDLFTLKVLDYMIYLIQNNTNTDEKFNGRTYVRVYATDFIKAFGYKEGNSFVYDSLERAGKELITLFAYVPSISAGRGRKKTPWSVINLIEKSTYGNGVLEVIFTSSAAEYIHFPGKYYTRLDLYDVSQFETLSSSRLFELLKSKAYEKKWESEDHVPGVYTLNMGISELRFTINTTDITTKVASELHGSDNFDKAMELSLPEDIRYEDWRKFKSRILDPAIDEINSKTDLHVTYDVDRKGKGGKATGITFTININGEVACTENVVGEDFIPESEIALEDKIFEDNCHRNKELFIGSGLSDMDILNIFKAADNDYDKVKAAYDLSKKQKKINNLVAWMITAIKNDYASHPMIGYSSPKKKNKFNDFPQRGEMMTEEQRSRYNELFERKFLFNAKEFTPEEEAEYEELEKIYNKTRNSGW